LVEHRVKDKSEIREMRGHVPSVQNVIEPLSKVVILGEHDRYFLVAIRAIHDFVSPQWEGDWDNDVQSVS
jgi:hypothetical protein